MQVVLQRLLLCPYDIDYPETYDRRIAYTHLINDALERLVLNEDGVDPSLDGTPDNALATISRVALTAPRLAFQHPGLRTNDLLEVGLSRGEIAQMEIKVTQYEVMLHQQMRQRASLQVAMSKQMCMSATSPLVLGRLCRRLVTMALPHLPCSRRGKVGHLLGGISRSHACGECKHHQRTVVRLGRRG